MRAGSRAALLQVGLLWAALTFVFEIALGRMRGQTWPAFLADYDIFHGGLMSLALVLLLFAPLITAGLRKPRAAPDGC